MKIKVVIINRYIIFTAINLSEIFKGVNIGGREKRFKG